jgi:hypothetical protein
VHELSRSILRVHDSQQCTVKGKIIAKMMLKEMGCGEDETMAEDGVMTTEVEALKEALKEALARASSAEAECASLRRELLELRTGAHN